MHVQRLGLYRECVCSYSFLWDVHLVRSWRDYCAIHKQKSGRVYLTLYSYVLMFHHLQVQSEIVAILLKFTSVTALESQDGKRRIESISFVDFEPSAGQLCWSLFLTTWFSQSLGIFREIATKLFKTFDCSCKICKSFISNLDFCSSIGAWFCVVGL